MRLLSSTRVLALVFSASLIAGCSSSPSPAPSQGQDQELWFAFGLRRDQSGLQQAVNDLATQSSPQFLSASEVEQKYGPSRADARSATQILGKAGFKGSPDATGAVLTGTFTLSEAQEFFGIGFNEVANGESRMVAPAGSLEIPTKLAGAVTDVAGGYGTVAVDVPAGSSPPADCSGQPADGNGLKKSRKAYGLAKSGGGNGVNVTLLEVDTYVPAAIETYAKCTGNPMPDVTATSANASPGQLLQSNSETSLDVVTLGLLAPQVDVDLIQYDPNSSIVFGLAAVGDTDLLSVSGGFCSQDLTDQEVNIAEWELMALAAQGTMSVVAAGDYGSSGCAPGNEQQAVMYPSESPNVLSVGGTQLAGDGSFKVWKSPGQAAGGGGPSARFGLPDYQRAAGLTGGGRQTPDVAFLAAPSNVGPIVVCDPGQPCSWEIVAGTSATAPGVAGGMAQVLQAARETQLDRRVGLLNPRLYAAAQEGVAGDITEGDNDLYQVGCCSAGPGYDMASGWGSLNFDNVRSALVP